MLPRLLNKQILNWLSIFPAVGIIGPRQVGKTTLAKSLSEELNEEIIHLDLERPSDINKIQNAELYFEINRKKFIVIDEIQRMPNLFPILRYEIDQSRENGRFLILGSSSPELIRKSSESLAGRIRYSQLYPFNLIEVGITNWKKLWQMGGFPNSFLSKDSKSGNIWIEGFIQTLIERDFPMLGLSFNSLEINRLMQILAHLHGQIENASTLARSLGVSQPSAKKGINFLENSFIIFKLPGWYANLKKRIVKSPKLYFSDSGMLHSILDIKSLNNLLGHPVAGFSFEGFVIQQFRSLLPEEFKFYFYRTQDGAECDLIISKGLDVLLCMEIKLSVNPSIYKGIRIVIDDLKPKVFYFVIPGNHDYFMEKNIRVIGIENIEVVLEDINPTEFNVH